MKRWLVVGMVLLSLVGCNSQKEPVSDTESRKVSRRGSITEYEYTLKSGVDVTCLVYNSVEKAGMSCDWAGLR